MYACCRTVAYEFRRSPAEKGGCIAAILDGKIEITRSVPNQEPIAIAAAGNGIPYTENVTQTYMVQVPYTEIVDGRQITKVRAETRTRTVPVTRFRKRTAEEQKEFDEKMARDDV